METMQEIETKIRALLEIKRIKQGLTKEEKHSLVFLNNKYRDNNGHLLKGSHFINSDGEWSKV